MNVNLARPRGMFALTAGLVLATLLYGCSKVGVETPHTPHHLTIADGAGDVPTLNPHLFQETTLLNLSGLTMAWLARYDAQGRPFPELLTVIPTQANGGISADGKTITWHLRKGVKWSDGIAFNADDMIFSTKAVLNPANNEVGRDGFNLITKMDEPDKYTVVYHLSKPYAAFLPTFFGSAGANPCILPAHLLAKYPNINHVPYDSLPVGIGPFRYTAWRRGDSVEMEANPYYWRGLPKLKTITYKLIPDRNTLLTAMQTGEVDLWPQAPASLADELKKLERLTVYVKPSSFFFHYDMVMTRPLLRDVRVREAIRYAIDRTTILRDIYHGYGMLQEMPQTPLTPAAPRDLPLIPFDPAKAQALLDQAGWKAGPNGIRVKDGQRLSLQLVYYIGAPATDQMVELVRTDLRNVGIGLDVRRYALATFFGAYADGGIVYNSKYDLTLFSWGADPVGDISNIFSCKQIPPNGQNNAHYCNPQVEAWMDQFKQTYDLQVHRTLLRKSIQQIIADNPMTVIFLTQDIFAYDSRLRGFRPQAFTFFDDMMNVDI
jgi:peptide/nickel transport system substrate-binding protein